MSPDFLLCARTRPDGMRQVGQRIPVRRTSATRSSSRDCERGIPCGEHLSVVVACVSKKVVACQLREARSQRICSTFAMRLAAAPRQFDARRDYCWDAPASAAGVCAFRPAYPVMIPIATGTTPTATAVVPSSIPRASMTTPRANQVVPALTSIVMRSCLRRDSRLLICDRRYGLPPTVRLRLSRQPGLISDQ
jgi:hypothetical protein